MKNCCKTCVCMCTHTFSSHSKLKENKYHRIQDSLLVPTTYIFLKHNKLNENVKCRIWDSHDRKNKDGCLLGYCLTVLYRFNEVSEVLHSLPWQGKYLIRLWHPASHHLKTRRKFNEEYWKIKLSQNFDFS